MLGNQYAFLAHKNCMRVRLCIIKNNSISGTIYNELFHISLFLDFCTLIFFYKHNNYKDTYCKKCKKISLILSIMLR